MEPLFHLIDALAFFQVFLRLLHDAQVAELVDALTKDLVPKGVGFESPLSTNHLFFPSCLCLILRPWSYSDSKFGRSPCRTLRKDRVLSFPPVFQQFYGEFATLEFILVHNPFVGFLSTELTTNLSFASCLNLAKGLNYFLGRLVVIEIDRSGVPHMCVRAWPLT